MQNGGGNHVVCVPTGLPPEKCTSEKNEKSWITVKHRVVAYSKEKFELPLSFAHDVTQKTTLILIIGANTVNCLLRVFHCTNY